MRWLEDAWPHTFAVCSAIFACVAIFSVSQCAQKAAELEVDMVRSCTQAGKTWIHISGGTSGHCV